jgi:hypothetical protein
VRYVAAHGTRAPTPGTISCSQLPLTRSHSAMARRVVSPAALAQRTSVNTRSRGDRFPCFPRRSFNGCRVVEIESTSLSDCHPASSLASSTMRESIGVCPCFLRDFFSSLSGHDPCLLLFHPFGYT